MAPQLLTQLTCSNRKVVGGGGGGGGGAGSSAWDLLGPHVE